MPATGATKNSVAVQGSSRSPAPSGPSPEPRLHELGDEEHAAEQRGDREEDRRVARGERARAEEPHRQHRLARAQLEGDERDEQHDARRRARRRPRRCPSRRRCRARGPRPRRTRRPVTSAEAGEVERGVGPEASGIFARTNGISASPSGTLSQKIHSHAMPSVTAPPTSGPLATARPVTREEDPERRPAPLGRERGAHAASIASGITIAAPMPWTARAAISAPMLGRERAGGRGQREQRRGRPRTPAGARSGRRARRRSSAARRG